jgi:hypothetical protein
MSVESVPSSSVGAVVEADHPQQPTARHSGCSAVILVSISAASRTSHGTPVNGVVLALTAASGPALSD